MVNKKEILNSKETLPRYKKLVDKVERGTSSLLETCYVAKYEFIRIKQRDSLGTMLTSTFERLKELHNEGQLYPLDEELNWFDKYKKAYPTGYEAKKVRKEYEY